MCGVLSCKMDPCGSSKDNPVVIGSPNSPLRQQVTFSLAITPQTSPSRSYLRLYDSTARCVDRMSIILRY